MNVAALVLSAAAIAAAAGSWWYTRRWRRAMLAAGMLPRRRGGPRCLCDYGAEPCTTAPVPGDTLCVSCQAICIPLSQGINPFEGGSPPHGRPPEVTG